MDRMGFPRDIRGAEGEVQRYLQQRHQEKDLEDLLTKLDDTKNVSEDEMRALQKRLEDTEAQMTRILAAMQAMQSRVTTGSGEGAAAGQQGAGEGVETVTRAGEGSDAASSDEKKAGNVCVDSSPDTESFEVVKNRESASPEPNSSSDASLPSLVHLSEEGKDSGEDEGDEEKEELIDTKADGEESTVRHRKAGNADED
nr:hypothetical protein BaRGS_002663 [Batillaria attramentaria]